METLSLYLSLYSNMSRALARLQTNRVYEYKPACVLVFSRIFTL